MQKAYEGPQECCMSQEPRKKQFKLTLSNKVMSLTVNMHVFTFPCRSARRNRWGSNFCSDHIFTGNLPYPTLLCQVIPSLTYAAQLLLSISETVSVWLLLTLAPHTLLYHGKVDNQDK